MISSVLIANRGEIAVRVIRTCRATGRRTVAVHSDPDARTLHVELADAAISLPGAVAAETYLNGDAVVDAAQRAGVQAVHPGYGFLAENADFAEAVAQAGLVWVGPPAQAIRVMGDKVSARTRAEAAGVPCVPGTRDPIEDPSEVVAFGGEHGYPILIKAAGGGGGRGMRVVREAADAPGCVEAARREALAAFGDPRIYLERYLEWPRHVEVQVLADRHGGCVALGERDCSVQRRHQKLVEEAPAPALSDRLRHALHQAAVAVAGAVDYIGAGTVEFLVEGQQFYFLEMNTRLQVEHPVTEEVFGIDLVAEQLRIAEGERLDVNGLAGSLAQGHAIEVRLNAEDPAGGRFLPSPGIISLLEAPGGPGVRFDGGYRAGDEVAPYYDNLVGKLIAWGPNRESARHRLLGALREFRIGGIATTIPALVAVLGHDDFIAVRHSTAWLESAVTLPDSAAPPVAEAGEAPLEADGEHAVWVAGRRYVLEPPIAVTASAAVRSAPARRARSSGPRRGAPAPTAARPAPLGTGGIVSPMQGTVIRMAVATGDSVAAGDLVCVLEAMKMENEVIAEQDGTVAEVCVAEGQGVSAGEILVRIDR